MRTETNQIARHRRPRDTRRRRGTSASATSAVGEECAGRRSDPAHAVVAGLAQRHRAQRGHLRGDRGDLLYRPAWRGVAGGDGAGVSVRDPDHDDVGRRDGRRRRVSGCARTRCRRCRPRIDAGRARIADRRVLRIDVHAGHADFRTLAARIARRPWPRAGLRHRLRADFFRRRGGALADEFDGGNPAWHRQHEAAVADDAHLRHLSDHSRWHARPRSRSYPAIRHARRRRGLADRLPHQHSCDGMVSVFRPGARHSQDQGTSHPMGDVRRHPQSRSRLLFLAAAVGAQHQHLHAYAGGFRHADSGRLRHRRAARVHADLGCVRGRDRLGAHGRHGDRRGPDCACEADCLDRGPGLVRLSRRDRHADCDLSRPLGRDLHP